MHPSHARGPSGPYPVPGRDMGGRGNFVGSPPKRKNTSHVPCKFYPYGTCQAGASCEFSHDLDSITQNAPCKYFAKGSCKFGQSCALAHILPNGRVVNRAARPGSASFSRHQIAQNGPIPGPPPSLLSMQANDSLAVQQQDFSYSHHSPTYKSELYSPEAGSPYGSQGDGRFAASPPRGGLSVLDAPLPSSFDSQGISHAARHGPFASSVPGRFGIESPPSSLPNRTMGGNNAFRDLRESAYGDTANLNGVLHGAGSSPPAYNESLTFAKRPLHSERFAKPRGTMSSSLDVRPTPFGLDASISDDSSDDGHGEDLLPSSLHDLLPQEKLRRSSRNATDDDSSFSPQSSFQRRVTSNGGQGQDNKTGNLSPLSGSPSRYASVWNSRPSTKSEAEHGSPSAFGHVGSPLRPSNLRTSSLNVSTSPNGFPTGMSPIGTPPRQGSMSMLTHELQRTKLADPSSKTLNPRTISNGTTTASRAGLGERGFSSSSSLGRDKIEEEQELFSMEDEDAEGPTSAGTAALPGIGADQTRKPSDFGLSTAGQRTLQ